MWPGVLASLERAHVVDYSINYYPPLDLLIATFKYTGSDYEGDMAKVAEDPETQRWWKMTDGMQESLVPGATGSGGDIPWWAVSCSIHVSKQRLTCLEYRASMKYSDSKERHDASSQ